MNPIIVIFLFMLLYQDNNNFPNHFDTFKLEKLLDKLNYTVTSLDHINHLNEIAHEPLIKDNLANTIEDSIHTVKPLFPEGKSQQNLDTIESIMQSMKKIGGLQNMAQNLGPVMKMLGNLPSSSLTDYDDAENSSVESNEKENDPYDFELKNKEDPYL